jgi:hypothetical protein
MIPEATFDTVSQLSHVGWGLAVVWGFALIGKPSWLWWVAPLGTALAAVKEFFYDQHYETTEVRGSNLRDFLFYCVGIYSALVIYLIRFAI